MFEHYMREILHVDDDPAITQVVCKLLAKHHIVSHAILDPRQVLDKLIHDKYRVVLLDIDMPHIDGLSLLREIKQLDGGIQVIMLTGLVNMSTVLESLRGGAEDCLFKPLNNELKLVDALETTFAKLDRWHQTIDELVQLKKRETVAHN